jgi:[acyl-carrier-protein] S-malonyltransferase
MQEKARSNMPDHNQLPLTALIFAGQGAQKIGMGKDFAEKFPEARSWFERANKLLGRDLASLCFEGPEEALTQTDNAQPSIFLVSWAAFDLLRREMGELQAVAAAGLSLGEFSALAAAGVFSFEESLRVVRERGRFMQEACDESAGAMAAILGLDQELTQEVCREAGVEIANLNCPGQIVISGKQEGIQKACELAMGKGARRALPLPVAGAYHSRLMAGAQGKLESLLQEITLRPARMPVISNVSARPHGNAEETKKLLAQQVTAPVRWEESMRHLIGQGVTRFIELGPGTVLSGFLKRIAPGLELLNVEDSASLEKTVCALRR